MWVAQGSWRLEHVGPVCLSSAPTLGLVPLFLLGNHLLILQCVQQTPLPGVEGWEPRTSLANHSPHTL